MVDSNFSLENIIFSCSIRNKVKKNKKYYIANSKGGITET